MTSQNFRGGAHTVRKLDIVSKYLTGYLTALKSQPFRKIYFDAFAGTGDIPTNASDQPAFDFLPELGLLEGSSKRALSLTLPFDRYVLVEKSKKKAAELKEMVRTQFPEREHLVEIVVGDVNDTIGPFCQAINRSTDRAVMFLDPFGNQVWWESIERIAATRKIDTWYLFPAGNGIFRQISKAGKPNEMSIPSVNRLLGTDQWQSILIEETISKDLFGNHHIDAIKTMDTGQVTEFVLELLKVPFGRDGVLDQWVPLGRSNRHEFSLIFACASPTGRDIAKRIASSIVKNSR